MAAFHTLTGNLLAERTLHFPGGWAAGQTQRAARESFQVGGKGFNVAKMLHRLGADVTAYGFAGGEAGAECRRWLAAHAPYPHHLFATTSSTRTGVVARAPGRPDTTWLAPDRAVDDGALAACTQKLSTLPPAAVVALCGSFPGWDAPGGAALRRHADRGGLVADTYGPPLAELVTWPLRLVKINADEFSALTGVEPGADRAAALREAGAKWPVRAWVITDGPRPVFWAKGTQAGQLVPPTVAEASATGSGDVLLAGLLHAWLNHGLRFVDALAWALPLAAANAASLAVAEFDWPADHPPSGNLQFNRTSGARSGPTT